MPIRHISSDPSGAFPDFQSVTDSGVVRFHGDVSPVKWIAWANGAVTFTRPDLSPFTVLTADHRERTDNPGCVDPTWIACADAIRAKVALPGALQPLPQESLP